MRVIVDAETGLRLDQRFGDFSHARWTEFDTTATPDAERFRWDGPVVDEVAQHDAADRRWKADMTRRRNWFAANVTAGPLAVDGTAAEVTVHHFQPDGGFEASLDGGLEGSLARRRRSADWWNLGWSTVSHRWSDQHWDWALSMWEDGWTPLTAAQLSVLKNQLSKSG